MSVPRKASSVKIQASNIGVDSKTKTTTVQCTILAHTHLHLHYYQSNPLAFKKRGSSKTAVAIAELVKRRFVIER